MLRAFHHISRKHHHYANRNQGNHEELREVSRFVCDVRVLRSGFWEIVESGDLVPGDVYEVTDPT